MSSFISSIDDLDLDLKSELSELFADAKVAYAKDAKSDDEDADFDAEAFADSVSDDLKSALKERGVDLEDVLSSYQALYNVSLTSSSASGDYAGALTKSSQGKLYDSISTLLDRQLATEEA
jgi:hypothetical protein